MFPEGLFCDLCVLYFVIEYYYFTQSRNEKPMVFLKCVSGIFCKARVYINFA
jgi:hypothetical protein